MTAHELRVHLVRRQSARASVSCSGVRLSVTYNLFATDADMNAWFDQQRELAQIPPRSGTCTPAQFRGERFCDAGNEKAGRYLCFLDFQWRCCLQLRP